MLDRCWIDAVGVDGCAMVDDWNRRVCLVASILFHAGARCLALSVGTVVPQMANGTSLKTFLLSSSAVGVTYRRLPAPFETRGLGQAGFLQVAAWGMAQDVSRPARQYTKPSVTPHRRY